MDQIALWISLGGMSISLWILLFRVIRRYSEESESKRREAAKAFGLILLSLTIQGIGRYLDREKPLEDALFITFGFLICLGLGIIINIKMVGPKAITRRQFHWDVISVLLVTAVLWLGIPYTGLIFLPSFFGWDLWFTLSISALISILFTLYDLVNG